MGQRYFIGLNFSIKRITFTIMKKAYYRIVGVMSGTSLDGIDLAHCEFFVQDGRWTFEIAQAETIPYEHQWQRDLARAHRQPSNAVDLLDIAYTKLLGETVQDFLLRHEILQLDAVCSHGHTVFHQPQKGLTRQIGNRSELAKIIGFPVVCDFRVQDVAMGGQGAPLVPIGDRFLFSNYAACLNIGGFANASIHHEIKTEAFDIAPANIILNHWANALGGAYDDRGYWASQGCVKQDLLQTLNDLPFYARSGPKSLGREWSEQFIYPLFTDFPYDPQDWLATYCAHLADQICRSLEGQRDVLVTGGGAFNKHLMTCLDRQQPNTYVTPEHKTIAYKEALIFGLLGVLRLREENNCLAYVTGAREDHCSGRLFMP
ncbi:anhydro-N-acetylmuramic acid kinase [Flavobacteriaceae bacterium]|nr:anhydro-N-acetylmuramic acid kinase [Flavobacteriaceae bacterium]